MLVISQGVRNELPRLRRNTKLLTKLGAKTMLPSLRSYARIIIKPDLHIVMLFFSVCERCHHSSHACAILPCHRITFVVIGIQLRLITFVQIAMAIPSPWTLSRLPRSSHLCKLFSLYRI